MLRKLREFWNGALTLNISGFGAQRFINICISGGCELRNLTCEKGVFTCTMELQDFWKYRKYSHKTQAVIDITGKKGLPFLYRRYRRRRAYLAGLSLAVGILYGMSMFIWDISIDGGCYYTEEVLIDYLKEIGIYHGMPSGRILCEPAEQKLREHFPAITWVSLQISGTRLILHLKENTQILEPAPEPPVPCDLIASEAGNITRMVTRTGIPLVGPGDTVEEGQLLISGFVPIKNDDGTIVQRYPYTADADIWAETRGSYEWAAPAYTLTKLTRYIYPSGICFFYGNRNIHLSLPFRPEDSYEITEYHTPVIFRNFHLPFGFMVTRTCVYQTLIEPKDPARCTSEANAEINRYIADLKKQETTIKDYNSELIQDGTWIRMYLTYTAEKKIGRPETLMQIPEDPSED